MTRFIDPHLRRFCSGAFSKVSPLPERWNRHYRHHPRCTSTNVSSAAQSTSLERELESTSGQVQTAGTIGKLGWRIGVRCSVIGNFGYSCFTYAHFVFYQTSSCGGVSHAALRAAHMPSARSIMMYENRELDPSLKLPLWCRVDACNHSPWRLTGVCAASGPLRHRRH